MPGMAQDIFQANNHTGQSSCRTVGQFLVDLLGLRPAFIGIHLREYIEVSLFCDAVEVVVYQLSAGDRPGFQVGLYGGKGAVFSQNKRTIG